MEDLLYRAFAAVSIGLLTPGPLIFVVLLLSSARGLAAGTGYFLGLFSCYTVIGWGAYWVDRGLSVGGVELGGPPLAPWVSMILGVLLLSFGVVKLRSALRGTVEEVPRFLTALDRISPLRAFGLGAMTAVMIFQNLGIYLLGVSLIVESGGAAGPSMLAIAAVALFLCLPALAPLLLIAPVFERAAPRLRWFKDASARNIRTITIVAMFLVGSMLIFRGLSALL